MVTTSPKDVLSLSAMHLPRRKLPDYAYQQICDLILNGEIKPGQLITIQALSESFGVSAMPIREALQKLTGARALAVISGRSIGIPPLTVERLLDLSRVRKEIEGATARWAAPHVSKDTIVELEKLLTVMLASAREGDIKAFLRANRAFHFTIYKLAESDIACNIIEKLWLQATPYFYHHYDVDRYRAANEQHEIIVSGLKSGNIPMVEQGIQADIENGCQLVLQAIR